jgi:hypothetical protein
MMNGFCIVILGKENSICTHCLDDMVLPLFYALIRLGYTVNIVKNKFSKYERNIIFCLQDIPTIDFSIIPENSIIYNTEQLTDGSKTLKQHYILALKKFTVWEYSMKNYQILKRAFTESFVQHVPLGYVPEMSRLDASYPKDIDVLFYGAFNDRRKKNYPRIAK